MGFNRYIVEGTPKIVSPVAWGKREGERIYKVCHSQTQAQLKGNSQVPPEALLYGNSVRGRIDYRGPAVIMGNVPPALGTVALSG